MKKIISLLLALAMLATTLISCANVAASEVGNEINPTAEETVAEPTADDTSEEATDTNAAETLQDAELADLSMFEFRINPIECMIDRITAPSILYNGLRDIENTEYREALCVVTALDIDLSQVNECHTNNVKFTLRVDKILASSNSFDLTEGDTFLTHDSSIWTPTDTGYLVEVWPGCSTIPVTDCQYIVWLEGCYSSKYEEGVDYRTHVYTNPITGPCHDVEAIKEQCRYMDILECAVLTPELIRYAFGDNYYPSITEFYDDNLIIDFSSVINYSDALVGFITGSPTGYEDTTEDISQGDAVD